MTIQQLIMTHLERDFACAQFQPEEPVHLNIQTLLLDNTKMTQMLIPYDQMNLIIAINHSDMAYSNQG